MDTYHYEVKFPGNKITQLAANIIAELVYAQCDVDDNGWSESDGQR